MGAGFNGFPREAFGFFASLERNNNSEWFHAHKDEYERACREPIKALLAELQPQYGPGRMSRINRDMRFSRDGKPYKTHLSAGVGGTYISLAAHGLFVGSGVYKPESALLARLRAAIDSTTSGQQLATIVTSLRRKGYEVGTHDTVASAPRGYRPDHPRIELLRMKDMFAGKMFEPSAWLSTRKALDRINTVIADLRPFREWLTANVPQGHGVG